MTTSEYTLPTFITSQWMSASLRNGPSLSLSKRVAEKLNWNELSFVTLANSGLASTELADFKTGGKSSSAAADSWLMDWLASRDSSHALVAEDWRADPSLSFLQTKSMPAFFYGDEVYYLIREKDPRDCANWRQMFSNTVPAFHAFVIRSDLGIDIGCAVTSKVIEELAASVCWIICGAYDGESYVVASAGGTHEPSFRNVDFAKIG